MATDKRSLRFESKDDAQRWRVFQAVEETTLDAAAKHDYPPSAWLWVRHPSGSYSRDTVAEAKAVADRNGWSPDCIRLHVSRQLQEPRSPSMTHHVSWVSADLQPGSSVIEVSVEGESEVEVNGVFALLESAVNAAKKPGSSVAAAGRSGLLSWWQRVLSHPYSVQILGGAGAIGLVALVVALWALLR